MHTNTSLNKTLFNSAALIAPSKRVSEFSEYGSMHNEPNVSVFALERMAYVDITLARHTAILAHSHEGLVVFLRQSNANI